MSASDFIIFINIEDFNKVRNERTIVYIYNVISLRVHLIKEVTVKDFAVQHAHSRSSIQRWLSMINKADWENTHDIQAFFPSADLLGQGSGRIVFDIGGNHYRIICQYNFGKTMVHMYVNWIGTHDEYTELCKEGRQYTIDEY